MIYKCTVLNKEFSTKEEMFKELRLYKSDIIAFKKAQILKSCEKGISITAKPLDYLKLSTQVKDIPLDDNYYYIAVNSTRILDKHLDLHLDGIWNKTTKDQQGKNYLVDTHVLSVNTTIAKKEHIEIFTAFVPFSMIGKKYKGDTEVLIYKIRKDKIIDSKAKEWLDSGDAIEASVRMQYIDIVFALNSDDKEDMREKKTYDQLIKVIANKEDFDSEITHFWGIRQAKNVLESSLVLFASNHVTGQMIDGKAKSDSDEVKCQDCGFKFMYLSIPESGMGYVKCPECEATVTQQMKCQPSEKDTDNNINEPSEDDTRKEFYLNLLKHKS